MVFFPYVFVLIILVFVSFSSSRLLYIYIILTELISFHSCGLSLSSQCCSLLNMKEEGGGEDGPRVAEHPVRVDNRGIASVLCTCVCLGRYVIQKTNQCPRRLNTLEKVCVCLCVCMCICVCVCVFSYVPPPWRKGPRVVAGR